MLLANNFEIDFRSSVESLTWINKKSRPIIDLWLLLERVPTLILFIDDTKLMQKLISTTSHNELQDDINRLIEWSKKFNLFNFKTVYPQ